MPKPLLTPSRFLSTSIEVLYHRCHAILGFYAVLHFLYRYFVFFSELVFNEQSTDMHFDIDAEKNSNLFTILFFPHLLLQLSGFHFHIPSARHPDGNRIWPQYRFEAILFFGRCFALLGLAWMRKVATLQSDGKDKSRPSIFPSFLIAMITTAGADIVASKYKKLGKKSRTLRDLNGPKGAILLMSSSLFHATLHSILTRDRLSVQFAALSVVQLSAFGMTLRRKTIITQRQGVALYGLVLMLGMIVIISELKRDETLYFGLTFGNIAALLRFHFRMNKYILWTAVAFFVSKMMQEEGFITVDEEWHVASAVTTLILISYAIRYDWVLRRKLSL